MPFQIQNFSRVSKSANEDIVNIQDPVNVDTNNNRLLVGCAGCFRKYSYFSKTWIGGIVGGAAATATGDSQCDIATPGYFNSVSNDLQVGDLIEAYSFIENSYATYVVLNTKTTASMVTISMIGSAKSVRYIDQASILSLKATVLITLVKSSDSTVVVVNRATFTMAAGIGYVLGANLIVGYTNSITPALTAAVPHALFNGNNALFSVAGVDATVGNVNKNIVLTTATAFIGGEQPLYVSLDYSILPLFANI